MFGGVVESFMRILPGIPRSLAGMGQGLLVAPYIPRDMEWAAGYTQTPWGLLSVEWKRSAPRRSAHRSGGAGQHRGAPSIWRPVLAAGRWKNGDQKNGDHDHGVIRYKRTV